MCFACVSVPGRGSEAGEAAVPLHRGDLIAFCVCLYEGSGVDCVLRVYLYQEGGVKQVKQLFPFTKFFDNAPQPLFLEESYEQDMDIADGCFRHIRKIFTQLEVTAASINDNDNEEL